MANITHSLAHQPSITRHKPEEANQELAAVRAEVAIPKDEVARLCHHVSPKFERNPQPGSSRTALSFQSLSTESSIPRYARPTQASENRSVKLTLRLRHSNTTTYEATHSSIQSTSPCWSDQPHRAKVASSKKHPHQDDSSENVSCGYLKPTRSSAAKVCPKISKHTVEAEATFGESQTEGDSQPWLEPAPGNWATVPADDRWATYEDKHGKPWTLAWLHAVELSPLKLSDIEYRDLMDLHVLVPATRLEDDKWRETWLQHMFIDDEQQARLLIQGRELAQKSLWNFAEKRMPGQNPWIGWQQVRFEWGELSQTWGSASTHYSVLKFRATEPHLVWDTMRKVIQLRHTTSHYSPSSDLFPSSLSEVDKHLKNVQKMAIQFYDEQSALKARKLRDELKQAAQDTFKELEALGTLVSLPYAGYPWKHHHECVFRRLILGAGAADRGFSELDEKFPETIGRIAEDWLLQHGWRGGGYEPPISVAASPRTVPTRRNSTSSGQLCGNFSDLVAIIEVEQDRHRRNICDAPYAARDWTVETQGRSLPLPRTRRRLSN